MCGDAPCEAAAAPSHESNLLELIELGDPGATPEADSPAEPHGCSDLAEIVALGVAPEPAPHRREQICSEHVQHARDVHAKQRSESALVLRQQWGPGR